MCFDFKAEEVLVNQGINSMIKNTDNLCFKYSTGYTCTVKNKPFTSCDAEYQKSNFKFMVHARYTDNNMDSINSMITVYFCNNRIERIAKIDKFELKNIKSSNELLNAIEDWIISFKSLVENI